MRWGKIRAASTKAGRGSRDWGPQAILVVQLVVVPVGAPVAM